MIEENIIVSPYVWGGFIVFVLLMLLLDLGVFHRKAHAIKSKEALAWTIVWIALAGVFAAGVWYLQGEKKGILFITAYLVEKSLSADNLFVFVVVFTALRVPAIYQHRVLFWGILSALILRAVMIFAGVALLNRFSWLMYVFGAFLVYTGIKLLTHRSEEEHPERSWAFRSLQRIIPSTNQFHGQQFFAMENGRRVVTPLFMALILLELTDVLFAVDSIPAVFGVTRDPFIVFTSNIFAILGLRSLYFLLARLMDKFSHLKVGLAAILIFVGAKMLIEHQLHIPPVISLAVIAFILASSIIYSMHHAKKHHIKAATNLPGDEPDEQTPVRQP